LHNLHRAQALARSAVLLPAADIHSYPSAPVPPSDSLVGSTDMSCKKQN